MERNIRILSIVLVLQLAAVALVWYFASVRGAGQVERLVSVDRDAVTAIEVAESADTSVRIEKGDAGWKLPGLDGLPADGEKVTGLVAKLTDADASWPVATSDASARRFEVTAEKFQRRIRLFAGDKVVAELYLGTSPGFRKVHARRADSADVYAITFANFEAPAKADEWLDKTLLQPKGALKSVSRSGGWGLTKADDGWRLSDLAQGEQTDADAARDVVSKINDLRILGRADKAPAEGTAPVMELTLITDAGTRVLRFFQPDEKADFVVGCDAYPGYFRVAAYIGEALNVDRAALLAKVATATPPAAAAKAAPVKP